MSNKNRKGGFIDFLAGKGFYIILILCIAAIGVSGYMLLFSNKSSPEKTPEYLNDSVNSDDTVLDRVPMPTIPSTSPKPNLDNALTRDDIPVAAITSIPTIPPKVTPTPKATATPSSTPSATPSATPKPKPKAAPSSFVWPVKGAAVNAFSSDDLVFNRTMGDWRVHLGLDIESALGTQVVAMADGTVKDIYDDVFLGTTVVIEHSGGLVSYYSNLMKKPTVTISQSVTAGQVIGGIGQTAEGERREVNHLHIQMQLNGKPVDPLAYLPEN